MTPEQRRLRAQIAANTRWSRPMAREDAADTARSAFYARLERQVDPQSKLQPGERDRLVRAAARAFSARLNSAKSRKQRPEPSALHIRHNQCPCRQPRQGHWHFRMNHHQLQSKLREIRESRLPVSPSTPADDRPATFQQANSTEASHTATGSPKTEPSWTDRFLSARSPAC